MATITLTPLYTNLPGWQGRLFESQGDETVLARTATSFSWRFGPNSDFAGYTVTATGTGFGYLDGDPVAGTMSSVVVRNAAGQVMLTIGGLTGFAADLSQFASNVFGSSLPDAGPGPDGTAAWSHLLSGNDTVVGTAGNDRQGLAGFDTGNDTYIMGAGDDEVYGGIGNDSYNGGDGYDRLNYGETSYNQGQAAFRGVTLNVMTGTAVDAWGGTDRFSGFEAFGLSRFNDVFYGNIAESDEIRGLRGNDIIDGGANTFDTFGNRTYVDDRDRVEYSSDYWHGGRFGIVVDLETSIVAGSIRGFARDGFGNTDTLIDIERVDGTRYGDRLTGSSVDNRLAGGEGRDTYDGGGGKDEVRFDRAFADGPGPVGVNVNMALATNQIINDGFGNTETMINIEEILGSDNADILRGNAQNNFLEGQRGADTLAGQGGNDQFFFVQADMNFADRVLDFAATGAGIDELVFDVGDWTNMAATLRLVNGTAATTGFGTFLFVNATDQLIWDQNGTGAGGQTLVAVLSGVNALTAANFELWV